MVETVEGWRLPYTPPCAVSFTSTLLRVAFEYGQIACADVAAILAGIGLLQDGTLCTPP
ncbi:MAG: hypothetical protein ACYDC6_15315 [Acidobacteriaceae bacterium]